MPSAESYRRQAAIFDRVATQCTVPELVARYEGLARDYRARAEAAEAVSTMSDKADD
jgi:hypothetical protein